MQQKKKKKEATKRFTLSHARNEEKRWWKELSMVAAPLKSRILNLDKTKTKQKGKRKKKQNKHTI